MGPGRRLRLRVLPSVASPGGTSVLRRLKKPAQRAIWSLFKAQAEYLSRVAALDDTGGWPFSCPAFVLLDAR